MPLAVKSIKKQPEAIRIYKNYGSILVRGRFTILIVPGCYGNTILQIIYMANLWMRPPRCA